MDSLSELIIAHYEQKWFQKLPFEDLSLKIKISEYHFLNFFLLLYNNSKALEAILTKKCVLYTICGI